MKFIFNIRKAVAAASFLCEMSSGKIEVRELLKMLYLADKEAILGWHRSITGDQIFSMPQGMVLSRIFDLARYNVCGSDMDSWKQIFTPRQGNTIRFQSDAKVSFDPLSEREEDALRNAFETIRSLLAEHGQKYINILHDLLPEWQNPNGSSILVEPTELLLRNGEDEDTIQGVSAEIAALNSAKLALQAS